MNARGDEWALYVEVSCKNSAQIEKALFAIVERAIKKRDEDRLA